MKSHLVIWIFGLIAVIVAASCEKNISLDLPEAEDRLVVEGRIETGKPPVVILTKNMSYYTEINEDAYQDIIVTNANVFVFDANDTVKLQLFIPEFMAPGPMKTYIFEEILSLSESDTSDNPLKFLPFYSDPNLQSGNWRITGQESSRYWLMVSTPAPDTFFATAKTTIPARIPIIGLSYEDHPNEDYADSMVQVNVTFAVPDTFGNYVRYWTKRNEQPYYKPGGRSVFDDRLFVGSTVTLPLQRGAPEEESFDFNTSDFYWRGDTLRLKWSNIDRASYNFYNTLESDNGDSPFSTPSIVQSNIDGGLGIWAGYSLTRDSLFIPE